VNLWNFKENFIHLVMSTQGYPDSYPKQIEMPFFFLQIQEQKARTGAV
jgi:hypothetical protein